MCVVLSQLGVVGMAAADAYQACQFNCGIDACNCLLEEAREKLVGV